MELKLKDGSYVTDERGVLRSLNPEEAAVQRALMRIAARRGGFAADPEYGSRLYTLGSTKPSQRAAAARQHVMQALASEREVTLEALSYTPGGEGCGIVELTLRCGSTTATAGFNV